MTVTQTNLEFAEEMRKTLPDEVQLEFTPLLPMGRGSGLDHLFLNDDSFLSLSRKLICDKGKENFIEYIPGVRNRGCNAGVSNISIDDSGDVYPCHLFHFEKFRMGNVFTDSFSDIFYSERIKQYVHSMDIEYNNDKCKNCTFKFLCAGGCKANTLFSIGDHKGKDLYCKYLKNSIIDNLFMQCDQGNT
jgi:radical SAM protein with 4Fe4S-binding SPASM domain